MKNLFFPVLLLIALFQHSCCEKEDNNPSNPETINCDILEEGLIFSDEDAVEAEINALCQNYPPSPTADDDIGHEENLNAIIIELNNQCSGFVAELGCYACLESLPLQSVIDFTLDSAGVGVKRYVNLWTPDGELMTYRK
jgi:hypothetical protein